MENLGLFQRYELFVATATIAAHANAAAEGFRQKDLKFVLELFLNWIGVTPELFPINNTQVSRVLDQLVTEGYARRTIRKKWPWYRLTRVGLIELLGRAVNPPERMPPEHFFFLYYFVNNYQPKINQLIESEGKQFPSALRLEVEELLNSKALVRRQIARVEKELRMLKERMDDSVRGAQLAKKLYSQGFSSPQVAAEVEKLYPYEMNSQKPLSELFAEIPPDISRWELEVGNVKRPEQIWTPMKTMLESYLNVLRRVA